MGRQEKVVAESGRRKGIGKRVSDKLRNALKPGWRRVLVFINS